MDESNNELEECVDDNIEGGRACKPEHLKAFISALLNEKDKPQYSNDDDKLVMFLLMLMQMQMRLLML